MVQLCAVVVDTDTNNLKTRVGQDLAMVTVAVGFDADPAPPFAPHNSAQEPESLAEAGTYDHRVGRNPYAPGTRQILGQGRTQLRTPSGVAVTERGRASHL